MILSEIDRMNLFIVLKIVDRSKIINFLNKLCLTLRVLTFETKKKDIYDLEKSKLNNKNVYKYKY